MEIHCSTPQDMMYHGNQASGSEDMYESGLLGLTTLEYRENDRHLYPWRHCAAIPGNRRSIAT